MKQSDISLLMKAVAPVIGQFIEKAMTPLVDRISELEQQIADMPGAMEALGDQRARDAAQIKAWMDGVEEKIASLPSPADPEPFDPETVRGILVDEVKRAVGDLPKPQDGKSVSVDDVAPLIDQAVAKAVALIPAPKDGVGLAGAVQSRDGNLVMTLSDGKSVDVGRVAGADADMDALRAELKAMFDAMPKPKDGTDALGLKDFDLVEDECGVSIRLGDGENIKDVPLPVVFDRGVYREGGAYRKGNGVTWGGSYWIAQKDDPGKPDTPDSGWRLAVKKGQNGRDLTK